MEKIAFHGSIRTADPREVEQLLRDWFPAGRLTVQNRLSGLEMVAEDDTLYIFFQEGLPERNSRALYLVEGNVRSDPGSARKLLTQLVGLCLQRSIGIRLEYAPVDRQGRETSDLVSLTG